jgi:hypothetical protein
LTFSSKITIVSFIYYENNFSSMPKRAVCRTCDKPFWRSSTNVRCPDCEAEVQRKRAARKKIKCQVCGKEFVTVRHHIEQHGMTLYDYKMKFPTAPIMSETLRESNRSARGGLKTKQMYFYEERIEQIKDLGFEVEFDDDNNVLVFDVFGEKVIYERYSVPKDVYDIHIRYCSERGLQPSFYTRREKRLYKELLKKGYDFHFITHMIWSLVYA